MKHGVKIVLLLMLAGVALWWAGGAGEQWLSFAALKEHQALWQAAVASRPLLAALAFALLVIGCCAAFVPGTAVLALAAGALFGFWGGLALISLASTVGAVGALLVGRALLHELVQRRFAAQLATVNAGIERDGPLYLLMIRLSSVFPFPVVNLVAALTPLGLRPFALATLVGALPSLAVFVNAGTQLAAITTPAEILSAPLLGSFALLALVPLLVKGLVGRYWRRSM